MHCPRLQLCGVVRAAAQPCVARQLLRANGCCGPPATPATLQEATYPTYIDFQAAMRLLHLHKSRKRMSNMRRRRQRQDKLQLKTWDHHIGE